MNLQSRVKKSYKHVSPIALENMLENQKIDDFRKTVLSIEKISNFSCISTMKENLKKNSGILNINIFSAKKIIIEHKISIISINDLIYELKNVGIETSLINSETILYKIDFDNHDAINDTTIRLKISGMTCYNCVNSIKTVLESINGVNNVCINLATKEAKINYCPKISSIQSLINAIKKKGYDADILDFYSTEEKLENLNKTKDIELWKKTFIKCLIFAIPLLFFQKVAPHFKDYNKIETKVLFFPGLFFGDVLSLILTIPIQFNIGIYFYKSAFNSLYSGDITMDTLICIGTSTAFIFSIFSIILSISTYPHKRPSVFFDTSAILITFITLGRYIENKVKSHTSETLSKLISLNPSSTTIYINKTNPLDRKEITIPTKLLNVNDTVIIYPGDRIPADGVIISGESYIDESMITGESTPVYKQKGSIVYSGTVNCAKRIEFEVTKTDKDTRLSQIISLVQDAQTSQASIQKFADKVSSFFVPLVLFLGVMTFIVWMILSHTISHLPQIFNSEEQGGKMIMSAKLAISVIIIACPCAVGLSTPTAIMVGTGIGAKNGILFKSGIVLETVSEITKVVFDKTGTLTVGYMSVNEVKISNAWKDLEILWWKLVYISEERSEHPIGKAIQSKAKKELNLAGEELINYSATSEAIAGYGVKCSILLPNCTEESTELAIGSEVYIRKILGDQCEEFLNETQNNLNKEYTHVYIAINNKFAGWISLTDILRANAAQTINALKHMKIDVLMATGDSTDIALKVGRSLNIPDDKIYSSITPEEKYNLIIYLQSQNETVAMVGDGINDSAALTVANIGIALSAGSDIAIQAADVILTHPDPILDVPAAIHLSRAIFNRIRLNMLWACIYNIISIPFAMGFFLPFGIYLHPVISSAAMACSSISVVLSSLLLKFWHRPSWITNVDISENDVRGSKSFISKLKNCNIFYKFKKYRLINNLEV
ncbi:hypothetical protein PNEG_01400 [Pneumocystis murina B123]|uniref:HMA domain-containing protein n=1 Tax=Pneumocystis murina (strain B123) TaxID=1069680 RepID=M7NSM0_PNEMU|nr:hypothetical protein PNEG_01400 [Pneumocystis murina B123]EMR10121.1 hypothetical protein PNEG_01400 [Pneumocystis murina B123]